MARLVDQQANDTDNDARVFAASLLVIRQRRGIADDEITGITPADVAAFLTVSLTGHRI